MAKVLLFLLLFPVISAALAGGDGLVSVARLEMFVDELPDMPRLQGYRIHDSSLHPGNLTIGMYKKTWAPFGWAEADGGAADKQLMEGAADEQLMEGAVSVCLGKQRCCSCF